MNKLTSLGMGLRCWPQWVGWRFCYHTGKLIDPNRQEYTPGHVQAGAWLLQLHELRDRLIYADAGEPRPVLPNGDLIDTEASTLAGERRRWHRALEAARTL